VRMSEAEYTHLTYDLTMVVGPRVWQRVNPAMRFLYVSGMGTGGKAMWARVKGSTENDTSRALSRGDHDPPRRIAPNARRALEVARLRRAAHCAGASLAGPPMALAQRRHHDRGARPRHDCSPCATEDPSACWRAPILVGLGAERHSRHEGTVRTRLVNEPAERRRVPWKRSDYTKHHMADDERYPSNRMSRPPLWRDRIR